MAPLNECPRSLEQGCCLLKVRSLLRDTKLDWIPSGIDRGTLLAASSDQEEDPATGSCDPTGG